MAIEKQLLAVPIQLFLANGGKYGQVQVSSTEGLKAKQKVIVFSNTQVKTTFEVKRVIDETNLILGPKTPGMADVSDLTMFLVADGASLYAEEQNRQAIPPDKFWRAVFEEEPTIAVRTILVDYLGKIYNQDNRFPVDAVVNIDTTSDTPSIARVAYPIANVESFFTIPIGTKKLELRVDGEGGPPAKMRIAYLATETADNKNYWTVMPGTIYQELDLKTLSGLNIYFRLNKGSQAIEIKTWA